MKLLAISLIVALPAVAAGGEALDLLAKARTAFLENHDRERYWNWTTITKRSVVDKRGKLILDLPSVTIESPIRTDGRRCNALLAWGDGREPYLATASADQRCTVEQEVKELFQEENLLTSSLVKVRSRSPAVITLAIPVDKSAMNSPDRFERCTASVQATLQLDPGTFFPKGMSMEVIGSGCEQRTAAVNHYDDAPLTGTVSTLRKGATIQREYVLQKDKAGDNTRDFWMCLHQRSIRPLRDTSSMLVIWGRRFELGHPTPGRHVVVEASTVANELATETLLKFDTQPKKDK